MPSLIESVERYRKRYGYYPEAVQTDKIYRIRENLSSIPSDEPGAEAQCSFVPFFAEPISAYLVFAGPSF